MEFLGWGILAGNSLLSFVLGKNCLGGLTWLEIAGIFLPQQDLPGWNFVSGNSLVSRSGCKLLRWSFLGGSSLQCSCSFLEFPFWNLRDLLASRFLQRNFLGGVSGWGILAGNSFLFFVLGKNCLGGLTWLEIAGIFLPQQDLHGWSFVSGNSLVSRFSKSCNMKVFIVLEYNEQSGLKPF